MKDINMPNSITKNHLTIPSLQRGDLTSVKRGYYKGTIGKIVDIGFDDWTHQISSARVFVIRARAHNLYGASGQVTQFPLKDLEPWGVGDSGT
jgi:hypothetical protein